MPSYVDVLRHLDPSPSPRMKEHSKGRRRCVAQRHGDFGSHVGVDPSVLFSVSDRVGVDPREIWQRDVKAVMQRLLASACDETQRSVATPVSMRSTERDGSQTEPLSRLCPHFDCALRPVRIIDEAHDWRLDVLVVLRVLTNFKMDSRLVVSAVLAGQNSLREKLCQDSMTCIRGRLAHDASLQLLSRDETRDDMLHRLKVAGAHKVIYAEPAHEAVYECTRGNLRAIDQLSLKSLQVAARQQAERVDVAHVVEAREMVAP